MLDVDHQALLFTKLMELGPGLDLAMQGRCKKGNPGATPPSIEQGSCPLQICTG